MNELLETIAKLPPGARYALYGAGRYTRNRIAGLTPADFAAAGRVLVGVIDDTAALPPVLEGVPLLSLREAAAQWDLTHLVLATDTYQTRLAANIATGRNEGWLSAAIAIQAVPALTDQELFNCWTATHGPEMTANAVRQILNMCEKFLGKADVGAFLDFGCGEHFPFAALFAARGVKTYATDVIPLCTDPELLSARQKWWLDDAEKKFGVRPPVQQIDARQYDGRTLPFPDAAVDLIASNSVLEHVGDVAGVLDELRRVLKPDGAAWLSIHYYPAINGFHPHDSSYYETPIMLPPGDRPWAHLLDPPERLPHDLNGWREQQFVAAIGERFEILHYHRVKRGDECWTPELGAQLAARGFHRDEVVTMVGQFFLRPLP